MAHHASGSGASHGAGHTAAKSGGCFCQFATSQINQLNAGHMLTEQLIQLHLNRGVTDTGAKCCSHLVLLMHETHVVQCNGIDSGAGCSAYNWTRKILLLIHSS